MTIKQSVQHPELAVSSEKITVGRLLKEDDLIFIRLPGVIHTATCLQQNFKYAKREYGDAPYGAMFISVES